MQQINLTNNDGSAILFIVSMLSKTYWSILMNYYLLESICWLSGCLTILSIILLLKEEFKKNKNEKHSNILSLFFIFFMSFWVIFGVGFNSLNSNERNQAYTLALNKDKVLNELVYQNLKTNSFLIKNTYCELDSQISNPICFALISRIKKLNYTYYNNFLDTEDLSYVYINNNESVVNLYQLQVEKMAESITNIAIKKVE